MKHLVVAALASVLAASAVLADATPQPVTTDRLVFVKPNGDLSPTGVVATVEDVAKVETLVIANEVAADAQKIAYAESSNTVHTLIDQIADQQVVIMEEDFVRSLGDVSSVSTNCLCSIKTYEHRQPVGGFCTDTLTFGFTEDIGNLNPLGQIKYSLSDAGIPWDDIECTEPQLIGGEWERGGVVYVNLYTMDCTYPVVGSSAFLRVFTEVTAMTGDGAEINIRGGVEGGVSGTAEDGMIFRGGFAMGGALTPAN